MESPAAISLEVFSGIFVSGSRKKKENQPDGK
jgi:hypothetical protein